MPANKIVLGLATYGRAFTLNDTSNHGLGAPTHKWEKPQEGRYTKESGFLAYYEICDLDLTVMEDNSAKAPYGYRGTLWVGFDNQKVRKAYWG